MRLIWNNYRRKQLLRKTKKGFSNCSKGCYCTFIKLNKNVGIKLYTEKEDKVDSHC